MPKIAIIGKPNVGKSTLFNRLIEKKKALVSEIAGTTRDRNYGICIWRGQELTLIDTGGILKTEKMKREIRKKEELKLRFPVHPESFIQEIQDQIKIALKESDLILFVLDVKEGLLPEDKRIASYLRNFKKPIILVLNKTDTPKWRREEGEYFKLGLGEPFFVSALLGSGTGDLLDEIIKQLSIKRQKIKIKKQIPIGIYKLSIVGKPNVGKSSLLNAILGEKRVIVHELPHVTREPQDIIINWQGHLILLVDTVGIRKKTKIKSPLEIEGVRKSLRILKKSDVALFVVEAHNFVTKQDMALASYIIKSKRGIVIVVNKWDLIKNKTEKSIINYAKYFYRAFPYLNWAPIIFISAKQDLRVKKVLDLALKVKMEREKRIEKEELEKFFKQFPKPKKTKRTKIKIYSLEQTEIRPPRFVLLVSKKTELHSSYLKFLEKRLREKFGFIGTPIEIRIEMTD